MEDVPQAVIDRLKKNEARQRYQTNRINRDRIAAGIDPLPCEKVDIIAIAEATDWTCCCHMVHRHEGCYKYLDLTKKGIEEGAPVIAHVVARSLEGGHTKNNVVLMRHECNFEISNRIEKTRASKYKRQRKPKADPRTKTPWKQKSSISKAYRPIQSENRWPPKGSRKIQSKGFKK